MADFLGSVNLVRVPVVERRAEQTVVQLGEQRLPLPGRVESEEALLSIRPETLRLVSADGPGSDGLRLPGRVVRRTFLGHLMRYTVQIGQQEWLVDQPDPGGASLAEGAVCVLVNPRRVHLVPEADT